MRLNHEIVIVIIIGIIILCTIGLFINKNQSNKKIYLTKKYYDNKKQIFLQVDEQEIKKLKEETFLLYTYNSYCKFPVPCDSIFEQFMKDNNITILSIPYEKYKLTDFVKKVKYAPSVLIINKNKVIAYLDADKDEDVNKYQDIEEFTNWVKEYIYLKNKK